MNFKKTLLLGNKGQLGKEFHNYFQINGLDFLGLDIDELNVTDYKSLKEIINSYKPNLIINCTAFNLVDKAETEFDAAYDVNANVPKYLAEISKRIGSFLIHYSSDYVFDGKTNLPYLENDITNPINNYGKTKLDGENLIKEIFEDFLIFRLSWVYGDGTQNFVYKFKEWAKNNYELNIADDEISIPTSTKFIQENTVKSISKDLTGLFHLVPDFYCSRFEWAEEIAKKNSIEVKLNAVNKSIFNLAAKRPDFSAMDNSEIKKALNLDFEPWQNYLY